MEQNIVETNNIERNIMYLSEMFISEHVVPIYGNENINELNKIVCAQFNLMLLYIKKHLKPIDYSNIEQLDTIFSVYIELCIKYNRIPTIQGYSFLTGISQLTIDKWYKGVTRVSPARMEIIKKWKDVCKNFLIDDLSNSDKTSVNKIFVAKAVHGLSDAPPPSDFSRMSDVIAAADLPQLETRETRADSDA